MAAEQPSTITAAPDALGGSCLVCGSQATEVFFRQRSVPILSNAPEATAEAARAVPVGDIELVFCPECGMVFNRAFSPTLMDYGLQYENSLHFSGQFDQYIRGLATDLVERLHLRGKNVIELGCGKGDFLALLASLGGNHCVGFDRSYQEGRLEQPSAGSMRIVRDFYTDAYRDLPCDLLCCRHVLEHIPTPREFLGTLRQTLGGQSGAVTFFEVPNALYTLRHRGIWDIIYEHVSYYWELPLRRIFSQSGFAVRSTTETYGQQFLCIEAVPGAPAVGLHGEDVEKLARVAEDVRGFAKVYQQSVDAAQKALDRVHANGNTAVIWGTGSKGITFLNLFKHHPDLVAAVDINHHKQGRYVAGTGHRIVSPEALRDLQPSVVFVMNPLYQGEIAARLAELGLAAELVCV